MKLCGCCKRDMDRSWHCSVCKRELFCGAVAEDCTEEGCRERRAPGGPDFDTFWSGSNLTDPRRD